MGTSLASAFLAEGRVPSRKSDKIPRAPRARTLPASYELVASLCVLHDRKKSKMLNREPRVEGGHCPLGREKKRYCVSGQRSLCSQQQKTRDLRRRTRFGPGGYYLGHKRQGPSIAFEWIPMCDYTPSSSLGQPEPMRRSRLSLRVSPRKIQSRQDCSTYPNGQAFRAEWGTAMPSSLSRLVFPLSEQGRLVIPSTLYAQRTATSL